MSAPAPGPGPGGEPLRIGGLERLSVVDWPGMLSAVVFCQGCAWRCRYCHNTHLQPFRSESEIAWEWVLRWLGRRRGLLDAVVFSGGEATHQPGLSAALRQVRELGFKAGLHTAGPDPEALREVLPLLDWVGFDCKAPVSAYERVTGRGQGERAMRSLSLVLEAGVPCEVRTTWHPDLISAGELAEMGETLRASGVGEWVIQRFRPEGCADPALCAAAIPPIPSFRRPEAGLKITLR